MIVPDFPWQKALLNCGASNRLLIGARQVGKTTLLIYDMINGPARPIIDEEPRTIVYTAHCLSEVSQARKTAAGYLSPGSDGSIPATYVVRGRPNRPGDTLYFAAAEEPLSAPERIHALYLDEPDFMPYSVVRELLERVTDTGREGPVSIFIAGTPDSTKETEGRSSIFRDLVASGDFLTVHAPAKLHPRFTVATDQFLRCATTDSGYRADYQALFF